MAAKVRGVIETFLGVTGRTSASAEDGSWFDDPKVVREFEVFI